MYSGTVLFIAFVGFLVSFWTEEIVEEEKLQKLILQRLNDIHHRLEALEKRQR